jgi:hypothetical protein
MYHCRFAQQNEKTKRTASFLTIQVRADFGTHGSCGDYFWIAAVVPFSDRPGAALNAFFPSLDAIALVTELITAVLLDAQFSISRSRSLLVLARTAVSGCWRAFTSNWREITRYDPPFHIDVSVGLICKQAYARAADQNGRV